MKTTRIYQQACTWCNATGFVTNPNMGYTTSIIISCPVCNGTKTVIITEVTEFLSELREELIKLLRFIANGDDIHGSRELVDTLTKEHYMKFVEWLDFGSHDFYLNAEKDQTGYYQEGSHTIWTIEEVYKYWLKEVLNK